MFIKDVAVPLQEAELVGTSSSNNNYQQEAVSNSNGRGFCKLIVKYIRGLRSASTANLLAALDLHSASCFTSNRTDSAFQPVANKNKGLIKSRMQQHLVNFSLLDAISIAKLDIDTDFQPAGLGVHGLRSANSTLPAGLGLRSANSSNLSAGLGLCSANSSNLSAGHGLHAASWNSNKTFKLVVASVKKQVLKRFKLHASSCPKQQSNFIIQVYC